MKTVPHVKRHHRLMTIYPFGGLFPLPPPDGLPVVLGPLGGALPPLFLQIMPVHGFSMSIQSSWLKLLMLDVWLLFYRARWKRI